MPRESALLKFSTVELSGTTRRPFRTSFHTLQWPTYIALILNRKASQIVRYFGSHSFRIGAATTAAAAGVPDHLTQVLGRWTSNAYMPYIRTPRSTLANVAKFMC